MPEFENNDKSNVPQSLYDLVGTVVLPIGVYNDLLRRADAANNAITLCRRDYHKHKPIEAIIDKHWLYGLLMDKLHEQYSLSDLAGYEIARGADDLLVLDVALAKLKQPDEKAGE